MFEHWPQRSANDRADDQSMFNPYDSERDHDPLEMLDHSEHVAHLVESCLETLTETELSWYEGETTSEDIAQMVKAMKPDNRGLYDDAEIGRVYRHRIMKHCLEHVQRRLSQGARDDQVFEVFA